MMNGRLVLVVSLWLKDANITRFETFEREAARGMAKYGGRIERAIRLDDSRRHADQPFEIHIVSFPEECAFVAYQEDPDARKLASSRSEVIANMSVLFGRDVEAYA
ncbi:MAG: hypothetical protein L0Z53_02645 [Acidobacteriales bacterium]|nr:hypothetical protein [Terriglobales bacterium]